MHAEEIIVTRRQTGQSVDEFPPVREEDDLTIMAVVEEVLLIARKYLLKEEMHIGRIRTIERHRETVQVRDKEAVITRTPIQRMN